jgi:hypothetical protein
VCVIESKTNAKTPAINLDETNLVLAVSWNRKQNAKITLPFRPAVTVQNTKLLITDQEPTDVLRVIGAPSILSQIRVLSSHEKYVAVVEETSDEKTSSKYSVYLKSSYLRQISSSPPSPQMSVYVVSEATDQNISVCTSTFIVTESGLIWVLMKVNSLFRYLYTLTPTLISTCHRIISPNR